MKIVVEPPSTSNPTTTSEIGATSHGPDTIRPTSPVQGLPLTQEQSQPATGETLTAPLSSNAPTSSAAPRSDTPISSSPHRLTHLLHLYRRPFLFSCLLPRRTLPLPRLPCRRILPLLYLSRRLSLSSPISPVAYLSHRLSLCLCH